MSATVPRALRNCQSAYRRNEDKDRRSGKPRWEDRLPVLPHDC